MYVCMYIRTHKHTLSLSHTHSYTLQLWEQQLKRPMGARAQSMLRVSIAQVGAVCMRM